MKRPVHFMLAIFLLSFFQTTSTRAERAQALTLPGLSVSGTQIMANGQPVRLRGINMGDPFWARNPDWYPNYSAADYLALSQTWRANVVRISIFPTQWKNMNHTVLLTGLSQEINAALDNGLYVIISWHVIGWPDGYYQPAYPGNPADTYDSSMSVATSFWSAMAQSYGSDTRIIFDLWNEPAHPDDFTLHGSDPNPLWSPLKGYYQSLIQTVRNNGGQNIVIATGNRWASWLVGIKDNPLTDSNLIYAYHKYSVNESNTPTEWNKDTGGLIGLKPVIVSEWGYEDTDAGANPTWPGSQASYGDPFTQWMESRSLSNLAWMYHHDWTPALLKADESPTLYGAFVRKYIRSHNAVNSAPPAIAGCTLFPPNNIWNTPIDDLPVDPHSSAWVNSIGSNTGLHMDFGSGTWDGGPIGIPYNISNNTTPKYSISFLYANESDPGPYPIPANPKIEHGSDHHLLDVDQSTCKLYETWDTRKNNNGTWSAGSGAIWDLNSNNLRPAGWTSADAAGLPILPGLVRYAEVAAGQINHAIRFTADSTNSYIWPARHLTSGTPGVLTSTPPMGARFRLKASFDISGYPPQAQVILQAMKTYGIILADNGSDWYISGVPDPQWDNDLLHLMDDITGSNFEAVNSASLMVNPNSGATSVIMISGNVGVVGVTLSYNDSGPKTATSDGAGNYSITIPYNWSGVVTPSKVGYAFSPASRSYASVKTNLVGQNYAAVVTISGNVGASGITLNYTDGIARSAISQGNGNYSFTVPYDWSGTVTPAPTCFTFTPTSKIYGNVTANQTAQNYAAVFNAASGCSNIRIDIGGNNQGSYGVAPQTSTRASFAQNSGPVKATSPNAVPFLIAERDAWLLNGVVQSFSEMMGLPGNQVTDTYYFPWYNNVTMDTQLRFANLGAVPTDITVTIAGIPQPVIPLAPGVSTRVSYQGINAGPVKVQSSGGVPIIVAERDAWLVNGVVQSFSEMMGLPGNQVTDTYYFPWYNNVTMDTQLRLANLGNSATNVTVTIAGQPQMIIPLAVGESTRVSYAINNGPVKVASSGGVPIIVAERDAWLVNGVVRSFSEMMGLPGDQLTTTYHFPWYNNVTMDTQLRFANLGNSATNVTVTIAGVPQPVIPLAAGESTRISYAFNDGPVKVQSSGGVPIIVAERDAWLLNGAVRSFSEMMGLPGNQLTDTYYFPWYNNITMDTQLRFAVP